MIATGQRRDDKPETLRSRSAAINAARAAYESDLAYRMQPIADVKRRERCLSDYQLFLRTYFPETFFQAWNDNRVEIVEALFAAARYGVDQAIAAPRGEGKSTITKCLTVYLLLAGLVRFPLLAAANGDLAVELLDDIKEKIVGNGPLLADFPELMPCEELQRVPSRAANQRVAGFNTSADWVKNRVIFPTVPDLFCPHCGTYATEYEPGRHWYYCHHMVRETDGRRVSWKDSGCGRRFKWRGMFPIGGAVIATRGLNSPIRGVNVRDQRPDIAIIDDPETRESADSPLQIRNRERVIESDIGGLAGPDAKVSRLILCTTQNRYSLAWKFTDRDAKPSFNGIRQRFLVREPDRVDLWEEYVTRRRRDQTDGDRFGRGAFEWYVAQRDEMDAGAIVSNVERYVRTLCPDGSPMQVSALQFYYDFAADNGFDAAATELQNQPPEDENTVDELDPGVLRRRFSGYGRRVVPDSAAWLTAGYDIGKRACHWAVCAWWPSGTGCVVDYGVDDVVSSSRDISAIDAAIERTLDDRRDAWHGDPGADGAHVFYNEAGELRTIDRVLIDAGYRSDVIYSFAKRAGREYEPAMGYERDDSAAFAKPNSKSNRSGDGYKLSRQPSGVWLVIMESIAWKRWVHDRFREPVGNSRALALFELSGESVRDDHSVFASHIVAERDVMKQIPGSAPRLKWEHVHGRPNHWLDAVYMSAVAAARCGMRRDGSTPAASQSRGAVNPGRGWFQNGGRR